MKFVGRTDYSPRDNFFLYWVESVPSVPKEPVTRFAQGISDFQLDAEEWAHRLEVDYNRLFGHIVGGPKHMKAHLMKVGGRKGALLIESIKQASAA